MLNVSLIGRKVDSKGQQFNTSNIGMREKNQFQNIVHTISVGQSVPDSRVCRQQVQNVQGSHAIRRVLGQQIYKLWDQTASFYHLSA